MKVKWHRLLKFCEPAEYLTVSQCCPVNVSYMLSSYYGDIVTANSKVISEQPTAKEGEYQQIEQDTLNLTFIQKKNSH